MKKGFIVTIIIVVVAVGLLGCATWGGKPEFQITSLTITPTEVMAGEKVTVSVDVANVGSREGTYEGTLTINGQEVGKKSITVAKKGKEKLTFPPLSPGAGGMFNISVGGLNGALIVRERVKLKYDDGRPDELPGTGIIILGAGGGYLVKFSPPVKPFTISKVRAYGSLYGEISPVQKFQVEIWDENQEIIDTDDTTYPYTKFSPTPAWAELAVDNVRVNGDFYVHVCTNSTTKSGIQIFYDSSVVNTHSDVTKNWKISDEWYPSVPKEQVNWMIRVDGTIIGTTRKIEEQPTTP
jgi:hypothetical protein